MTAIKVGLVAIVLYYVFVIYPRVEYKVHSNGGAILITGASSGIGHDAAMHLAHKHPYTVFAGVRKQDDAKKVLGDFNAIEGESKGAVVPVILDVTNREHIDNVAKQLEKWAADNKLPVVGLVNNAGVSIAMPADYDYTLRDRVFHVMNVNLLAVMDLTSRLLPQLREHSGRVVNIGSISGFLATRYSGVYSAAKYGLEGYSDALRRDMFEHGVSCSVVEPGFVHTKIGGRSDSFVTRTRELVPKAMQAPHEDAYYNRFAKKRSQQRAGGYTTAVTNVAIEHALVSSTPYARYPVAGGGGFTAYQLRLLVSFFPDRFVDMLLRLFGS